MKVKIHDTTYIFLLLSFLSGYFEYIFLLLLVIFIHESGHYLFSIIMNINVKEIIIYPLGGIIILDSDLNIKLFNEFICLIGGITFQLLFWLLIFIFYKNNFITYHIFNLINKINILLISFNFMIILPLDGGRLFNILFNYKLCYLISYKVSLIISIIFSFIFILRIKSIYSLILFIFILKSIYLEYKYMKNKYLLFLFERYINNYNFKKIKYIKSINQFYRDSYHYIKSVNEKVFLNNLFTITK